MSNPQSNLFSFAFIDPTMLLSTMTLKYGKHFDDGEKRLAFPFNDCRRITLRRSRDEDWSADGEVIDYPVMTEWPTAKQIVGDIGARIGELLAAPNLQIGGAYLESLRPEGVIGWHADQGAYAKAHQRFKLLVSPCSGGTWYSGGEQLAPGMGNLTYVNNRALNSAINLGPVPQISLVIDFRKPTLQ